MAETPIDDYSSEEEDEEFSEGDFEEYWESESEEEFSDSDAVASVNNVPMTPWMKRYLANQPFIRDDEINLLDEENLTTIISRMKGSEFINCLDFNMTTLDKAIYAGFLTMGGMLNLQSQFIKFCILF